MGEKLSRRINSLLKSSSGLNYFLNYYRQNKIRYPTSSNRPPSELELKLETERLKLLYQKNKICATTIKTEESISETRDTPEAVSETKEKSETVNDNDNLTPSDYDELISE